MNNILADLKDRLEIAKARLASAQAKHAAATAELNAAAGEHNAWNAAVAFEIREQERISAEAAKEQMPLPVVGNLSSAAASPTATSVAPEVSNAPEPVNKTELVREALRLHHAGMTAGDLWKRFQGQISSRPYLYSILKRLRDKDEVSLRRGKYVLKPKPIEVKADAGMEVQTIQ
jgi:hypothetical protein